MTKHDVYVPTSLKTEVVLVVIATATIYSSPRSNQTSHNDSILASDKRVTCHSPAYQMIATSSMLPIDT
ncbi:hypothetical protein V9T40_006948 [Parthenolecanium corni]|uniref:Uncharacterized protein n=1 Tax=Parthenolecanium corni TaxID=536013 RepID=A0AAN9YBP7_9HEMI